MTYIEAARELLLDALANYDARISRVPGITYDQACSVPWPARDIVRQTLKDAAVRLDIGTTFEPSSAIDIEEHVAVHEEAVEMLTARIKRGVRHRKVVAL